MATVKQKKTEQSALEIALLVNNEKISLDYEVLQRILSNIVYNAGAEWQPIFALLAQHPHYLVRQELVVFSHLTQEMFNHLINDKNKTVVESLLSNDLCGQFLTKEHIKQIVQRDDTSLLIALINTLHELRDSETIDNIEWYEKLLTHSDPEVRKELASTENPTVDQIMVLTKDKDPLVAKTAKETLSNMDYDDDETDDAEDDEDD